MVRGSRHRRQVTRVENAPLPAVDVPTRYGVRRFSIESFRQVMAGLLSGLSESPDLPTARLLLFDWVNRCETSASHNRKHLSSAQTIRIRDCARALRSIFGAYADERTGFSASQALWDLARGLPRPDLTEAFFADLLHLLRGVEGRTHVPVLEDFRLGPHLTGRQAARRRSEHLERLGRQAEARMSRYRTGLDEEVIEIRRLRRLRILKVLDGTDEDWADWRWHVRNIVTDADLLRRLVTIPKGLEDAIRSATQHRLPFAITPYYLSLMDDRGDDDRALRAQVMPPPSYVQAMIAGRTTPECSFDYMREQDTSPIDLITRRYPGIVILKPYNTCPQICVYCQRNWEIEEAMAPGALAPESQIEAALVWIRRRPSIHEVLITGGDPMVLGNDRLRWLLDRISAIPTIERIRIGTRTPVTVPFRFTDELVKLLAAYRKPGHREIAMVTHVQHPYEINPEMVNAVDRLRRSGIPVYNQLVYTFYVSRRFEATLLRRLLRLTGIDPYYTFNAKGKHETEDYRVPIARLLQEQKEEARILPGLSRTDESVFNIPGLGKNYLRAIQHRDILTIRSDGARIYEFHPWEKNIAAQDSFLAEDVPILAYLRRLAGVGERPEDYESIWYYF